MIKSTCCFQRTPAKFLAPTSGGSQPPVTPDLGSPMAYAGLTGTHVHMPTGINVCIHTSLSSSSSTTTTSRTE